MAFAGCVMCSNEEMQEMIECFNRLPDMYQQSVLSVVRDRTRLYEMQMNLYTIKMPHLSSYLNNEVSDENPSR
jgi:hypothetical protein